MLRILIATTLVTIGFGTISGLVACGAEVQFVGEDGQPIPNLKFYLYELRDGNFHRAIHRDFSLGKNATIALDALPTEYMLGIENREQYYCRWWDTGEFSIDERRITCRVEQSGAVGFTFTAARPKDFHATGNPMVLAYYRKKPTGDYEFAGGVGVFLQLDKEFTIHGLVPDDYRFELKKDYESTVVFWSVENVALQKRVTVHLANLVAVRPSEIANEKNSSK